MTTYTDTDGKTVLLCDHCRSDLPLGSPAFLLSPGEVGNGYVGRDYARGELVICPTCARIVGQIMTLMGLKRADSLTVIRDAA